jgi:hypothetical protein
MLLQTSCYLSLKCTTVQNELVLLKKWWIRVAEGSGWWQALMNTLMNLQIL